MSAVSWPTRDFRSSKAKRRFGTSLLLDFLNGSREMAVLWGRKEPWVAGKRSLFIRKQDFVLPGIYTTDICSQPLTYDDLPWP